MIREVVVWLGLGPFEATVHSLGLLVFSILLTLKVESVIGPSWHVMFSPLYAALFIDAYYNCILGTRMVIFSIKEDSNRFFCAIYSVLTFIRLVLLLYVEIQTANVLNTPANLSQYLISPLILLLVYLSLRFLLLFRTLPHNY